MLVLSGPSASGKSEIVKILTEKYDLKKLVTYTTRPPRLGEINGIDYNFVTVDEFLKLKANNEFLETTYYNNNYYGSRLADINFEKIVILDPSGVNVFREILKEKIVVVFLTAPESLRIERMRKRGDDEKIIEKRILNDRTTFTLDKYQHIDYIYHNETIELDALAKQIYDCYIKHIEKLILENVLSGK